jgi:hypothetical protein
MKKTKIIVSLVLFAGVAVVALQAKAENYGMAGCGLGSMAFGKDNGKIQIVAATLNGTGVQTFGITSGTSNCVDNGAMASAMYIAVNQEALKKDIARGSGESLNGLSQIMKCGDQTALNSALQKNFNTIFPSDGVKSDEITKNIVSTIHSEPALQATCQAKL